MNPTEPREMYGLIETDDNFRTGVVFHSFYATVEEAKAAIVKENKPKAIYVILHIATLKQALDES